MAFARNRWVDATLKLIVFSAVLHMFVLTIIAIRTKDITQLNYLNILDIDFFFPGVVGGAWTEGVAVLVGITVFAVIFFFFTKKPR